MSIWLGFVWYEVYYIYAKTYLGIFNEKIFPINILVRVPPAWDTWHFPISEDENMIIYSSVIPMIRIPSQDNLNICELTLEKISWATRGCAIFGQNGSTMDCLEHVDDKQ